MMLDLTPYKNPDAFRDLVASLQDAKAHYANRDLIGSARSIGASGSMFRVFRGIEKPSLIYQNWAFTQTQSQECEEQVLSLETQDQFERFHSALGDSLFSYWKDNAKGDGAEKELTTSHKLKLLDVFIKRACELRLPNHKMNDKLLRFGHVPLDSLVFNALDNIFSGSLLLTGRSMGDVEKDSAYKFYQNLIRELMRELEPPTEYYPLYLEFYAWDLGRKTKARS